jgi:hypothetical protein
MKICNRCACPREEFYVRTWKRKDGSIGTSERKTCKQCDIKSSAKQRTGPQRDAYLKYQRKYHKVYDRTERLERLRRLDSLKAEKPCLDCGNQFPPECMDFDHKDPKKKLFTISNAVVTRSHSWEEVAAEIAKCRLICANCHRIRTAKQNRRGL